MHCYILNIEEVGFMVSLRFLKKVFQHYKSMEANDPQGVVNLDPRGMVDRIYIGDRQSLLYTKYICCGPHGKS